MRRALILLSTPALLAAQAPEGPKAEVKVGLGIEKYELTGGSSDFKIAPDTKIHAWVRVTGITDGSVTVVFLKGGQEKSKQDLKVAHSPYRTHAYRTFRKGDDGAWTVKVVGADGAELGSASFTIALEAGMSK
ncbi:MAG TPA: DUF2914 domain-containing protein [Holophagaceae bacterium]|jgi:hypothetical protein|nr:DUF2914 domain-containing protein [Holophagaceae bacterium]